MRVGSFGGATITPQIKQNFYGNVIQTNIFVQQPSNGMSLGGINIFNNHHSSTANSQSNTTNEKSTNKPLDLNMLCQMGSLYKGSSDKQSKLLTDNGLLTAVKDRIQDS